ncbi:hypothetical protein DFH94DRAFT_363433 [Russula ochroleuca]|uniref:Uncharacterized protein n=1 Tax=Russula ochroleuca TaxID=152965 RepID=A0A9P5TAK0_9AGAM|nr:hypothetical protein DFH94DRAFT_363433 [Russula ochroleuca]
MCVAVFLSPICALISPLPLLSASADGVSAPQVKPRLHLRRDRLDQALVSNLSSLPAHNYAPNRHRLGNLEIFCSGDKSSFVAEVDVQNPRGLRPNV